MTGPATGTSQLIITQMCPLKNVSFYLPIPPQTFIIAYPVEGLIFVILRDSRIEIDLGISMTGFVNIYIKLGGA